MACHSPTFISTDVLQWIGVGSTFDELSLPDTVIFAFNTLMTVPNNPLSSAFCPDASVAKLLRVQDLPLQSRWPGSDSSATQLSSFFSMHSPIEPSGSWELEEVPSADLCFALCAHAGQAWLDGFTSVIHWRDPTVHLPFWIIHYWLKASIALHARQMWASALAWTQEVHMRFPNDNNIFQSLTESLESLGWGVQLCGFSKLGGAYALDIANLLHPTQWLNDRQMDALVGQLRERIELYKVEYVDVASLSQTASFTKPESQWRSYCDSGSNRSNDSFFPLRYLGKALESQNLDALYFPMFVNSNHFIPVKVTSAQYDIKYGCSMRSVLDASESSKLSRWLRHHGFEKLPVPTFRCAQQDDFSSCGLVTINAIEVDLFLADVWTPARKDLYRVQKALDMLQSHLIDSRPTTDTNTNFTDVLTSGLYGIVLTNSKEIKPSVASPLSVPVPIPIDPSNPSPQTSSSITSSPLRSSESKAAVKMPAVKIVLKSTPAPSQSVIGGNPRKRTLTDFFSKASSSEHRENQQRIAAQVAEAREERLEEQRQAQLQKEIRVKALGKDRQQRYRNRQKAAAKSTLIPNAPISAHALLPSAAEASRPKRALMALVPKDPKGRGRKAQKSQLKERKRTNWHHPILVTMIIEAQREIKTRPDRWNGAEIVRRCQSRSWSLFKALTPQVLNRYRDAPDPKQGTDGRWKPSFLEASRLHGLTPNWQRKRRPLLEAYPEASVKIVRHLKKIREMSLPVTISTIRAVVVALLQQTAPQVLVTFKCSDSWIRKFVFHQPDLQWVMRKPTRAGRKTPADADDQILNSFYRHVLTFRDALIQHPCFHVNMDETQAMYSMGTGLTFETMGKTQVPVLGLEDKRVFTLTVAVSGSGDLLPFQAIYTGKTVTSTPSLAARARGRANQLGFLFEFSGTTTYWANVKTLKNWVNKILVPYWRRKMAEFGVPDQECLLQLDVWSVHAKGEFKDWMKTTYIWIIVEFVPGGCTPLFQVCDVIMQRPIKLAIRQSQQNDLLDEAREQLSGDGEEEADAIQFDTRIGTIRDRSVKWLVDAYEATNKQELIKKGFELCKAGPDGKFNLSFESITSTEARQALRDVQRNDPTRWAKIQLRPEVTELEDDPYTDEEDFDDDILVSPYELVKGITALAEGKDLAEEFIEDEEDGHIRPYEEEDLEEEILREEAKKAKLSDATVAKVLEHPDEYGRGKRAKRQRLDEAGISA